MDAFETTIYTSVLITCIILGGVFIFAAITIYRNQRKHYAIQRAHFLAEIELIENERTRIARDMHDELGPKLAVIKFQIQASTEAKNDKEELIAKACANLDEITERMGGIAQNLTPRILFNKGLHEALTDFFDQFGYVSKIHFDYHFNVKNKLPVSISLHLYRMVQELTHNTIKHASASVATIQLKERKKKIYLYYKDNGIGITNTIKSETAKGIGLSSLQNRAVMLGGQMLYLADNGTEYFFEIPLHK